MLLKLIGREYKLLQWCDHLGRLRISVECIDQQLAVDFYRVGFAIFVKVDSAAEASHGRFPWLMENGISPNGHDFAGDFRDAIRVEPAITNFQCLAPELARRERAKANKENKANECATRELEVHWMVPVASAFALDTCPRVLLSAVAKLVAAFGDSRVKPPWALPYRRHTP